MRTPWKIGALALLVYGAVATGFVWASATRTAFANRDFDQITVHRIRVVEPDGKVRMIISNHQGLPRNAQGSVEGDNERPGGGIIFYNDEGRENGGLIFAGLRDANGQIIDSGSSLSFDKYGADGNTLQLAAVSDHETQFAGLRIRDIGVGTPNNDRVWVGNRNGAATLALMDAAGHRRIVMEVKDDGSASLTFLDANGGVLQELAPVPHQR